MFISLERGALNNVNLAIKNIYLNAFFMGAKKLTANIY